MDIAHRTSDQVRIPAVGEGEAVIVTRHGREVAAIVTIDDFRLLESLKGAIAATRVRPPVGEATLAAEAGDLDDDEFPEGDELARMLGTDA